MEKTIRLMIVDDDKGLIGILKKIFMMSGNFEVTGYTNPCAALENPELVGYDLLLVDLIMPEMDGLKFLSEVKRKHPLKHTIILTGQGSIDTAVEAMQLGAATYIEKPIDPKVLIQKIYEVMKYDNDGESSFKEHLMEKADEAVLVGHSQVIEHIRKDARTVSGADSSVLITGESGTGKELVAELIHKNSGRKSGPFIKINCAALPETLFESELFGYSKGAFTGADREKKGKIEQANHGTLFLDEIGELPLTLQTKLLRVLQQKEVERLGGDKSIKVDVRLICATNKNLQDAMTAGTFRDDLYYRINVISLKLPPLRERKDDIELLVRHFFEEYGRKMQKEIPMPSAEIVQALENYKWPGNVRELKNTIERLFVFGEDKQPVTMEELGEKFLLENREEKESTSQDIKAMRSDFERTYLLDMLKTNDWNVTHTAEQIGMSRRNLQKKMKLLEIKRPE